MRKVELLKSINKIGRMKGFLGNLFLFIFCVLVFFLSIRGIPGNPNANDLNKSEWRNDGPFEQTGRFALLYSVVEDRSFYFSIPLARFASPDLAMTSGKYVSLFAPGVSFLAIPGYLIGRYFGMAQVGTFAVISLFALSNIFLIRSIAIKLGVHPVAAAIGGITFAFATPAFPYGVDFYQHHISTFFILFSIFSLLYFSDFIALIFVWFFSAASITVDYPNFLMMLPIGIYALARILVAKKTKKGFKVELNVLKIFTFAAMILPLAFFLWFNQMSYGSPFSLSGMQKRVIKIAADGKPGNINTVKTASEIRNNQRVKQDTVVTLFNPRLMLNGFYIHFLSSERGILYYTPVMFFGFIGAFFAYKKKVRFVNLLSIICGINILIYSMWGDPWGGWAFGSRYLIPSYAILSVFIAYLLFLFRRRTLFHLVFLGIVSYSVAVNALGALTSSLNPPKIEAVVISREAGYEFKHTYGRNIDFLNSRGSKSYFFNVTGNNFLSARNYYIDLTVFIIIFFFFLLLHNRLAAFSEGKK